MFFRKSPYLRIVLVCFKKIDRRACRLVADEPETPTHLSILSDSVMRTPALNELPGDEEQGVCVCVL